MMALEYRPLERLAPGSHESRFCATTRLSVQAIHVGADDARHASVVTTSSDLHARPTDSSSRYLLVVYDETRSEDLGAVAAAARAATAHKPAARSTALVIVTVKGLLARIAMRFPKIGAA
jgi:hypothetical protein